MRSIFWDMYNFSQGECFLRNSTEFYQNFHVSKTLYWNRGNFTLTFICRGLLHINSPIKLQHMHNLHLVSCLINFQLPVFYTKLPPGMASSRMVGMPEVLLQQASIPVSVQPPLSDQMNAFFAILYLCAGSRYSFVTDRNEQQRHWSVWKLFYFYFLKYNAHQFLFKHKL